MIIPEPLQPRDHPQSLGSLRLVLVLSLISLIGEQGIILDQELIHSPSGDKLEEPSPLRLVQRHREPAQAVDRESTLGRDPESESLLRSLSASLLLEPGILLQELLELQLQVGHIVDISLSHVLGLILAHRLLLGPRAISCPAPHCPAASYCAAAVPGSFARIRALFALHLCAIDAQSDVFPGSCVPIFVTR